jgi:hypothetical protein
LASLVARVAEARHVHFGGPHPVAAKFGGGYCYIETPHMHIYMPDHAPLYQQVNDEYVFTGDPTPFGYEGDKFQYYGHHPIASVNGEPVYCYLEGPHFHAYEPPSEGYKMKKGVAFYVGPYTPAYNKMRPQRTKLINAEYRPYASYRPVVEVQPPEEWQGEVYVAPPAVEVSAPGVYVNAPGPPSVVVNAPPPPVLVAPPPPGIHVQVNAPPPPGVVVMAPAPRLVVAPPPPHAVVVAPPLPHVVVAPPAPHVIVAPPAPGVVVVGAPAPRGVVIERRHGDDEDGDHQGHHDHGKHKGWYK